MTRRWRRLQAFAAAHPDSAQRGAGAATRRRMPDEPRKERGGREAAARRWRQIPRRRTRVLYDLAWAQRNAKQPAAAMETYRRLLKDHPDSKLAPAARTELAEFLYADKKYAEAVELLEAVVADKQAEPKVLSAASYRLGWCYRSWASRTRPPRFRHVSPTPRATMSWPPRPCLQAGLASAEDGKFDQAEKYLADMLRKYPAAQGGAGRDAQARRSAGRAEQVRRGRPDLRRNSSRSIRRTPSPTAPSSAPAGRWRTASSTSRPRRVSRR